MLWHGGDPAGWNRHESLGILGIRFKSSVAGEIEDLLELLLRTFYLTFQNLRSKDCPSAPRHYARVFTATQDLTIIYVNSQTDKKQMTVKLTNFDISRNLKNKQTTQLDLVKHLTTDCLTDNPPTNTTTNSYPTDQTELTLSLIHI